MPVLVECQTEWVITAKEVADLDVSNSHFPEGRIPGACGDISQSNPKLCKGVSLLESHYSLWAALSKALGVHISQSGRFMIIEQAPKKVVICSTHTLVVWSDVISGGVASAVERRLKFVKRRRSLAAALQILCQKRDLHRERLPPG